MTLHEENGRNLSSRVYDVLEESILSGRYPVGAALTELGLSADLGTSRTPVREALRRLEQEGLVHLIPNKGAVVVGITTDDLIDIYRIRMRLEGLAAARAAEKRSAEDAARLTEIVELSEFYIARGDAARLRDLDSNFHDLVYLAGGSRMISSTLSHLHHKISRYRAMALGNPGRVVESVREHRAILEAILAHDANAADDLASRHVELALENLLHSIKT